MGIHSIAVYTLMSDFKEIYWYFCMYSTKSGDTAVMVTAVSKTKPSPSQFMPLVVSICLFICLQNSINVAFVTPCQVSEVKTKLHNKGLPLHV